MDKAIGIVIGTFLYGIFGNIFNNLLYYFLLIFRLIFEFIYFISNIFGIGDISIILLNITFYSLGYIYFKKIYNIFMEN